MSDAKKTRVKLEVFEIESLNVDQLDVEELEQRIELATGVPTEMGWVCDCDGNCTLCQHCTTLCTCDGTNTCTTYCGGLRVELRLSVLSGLRSGHLHDAHDSRVAAW